MRKLALIVLVFSIIDCEKASQPKVDEVRVKYVNVKDGLNVREAPDRAAKRIATIPRGEKLRVLEEQSSTITIDNITGKWTKISDGKIQGWAFGGFLTDTIPEQTPTQPASNSAKPQKCAAFLACRAACDSYDCKMDCRGNHSVQANECE